MRIQLASDLHLEFINRDFPGERLLKPAPDADVLVLAGDIALGSGVIDAFGDWPVPVLTVMGNHESYARVYEDVLDEMRERSKGTSVRFLENDVFEFEGVRFLGCTLWTDYRYRCNRTQRQIMENAQLRIMDHRRIGMRSGQLFSPVDALAIHENSREWLAKELATPFDGKTVVVTHHGPHPLSVHHSYAGDPLNGAFVSDLSDLLRQTDFWLHGHTHYSFDYPFGNGRVVVNPRGYPQNISVAPTAADLRFENPAFNPSLVIDTGATQTRSNG